MSSDGFDEWDEELLKRLRSYFVQLGKGMSSATMGGLGVSGLRLLTSAKNNPNKRFYMAPGEGFEPS